MKIFRERELRQALAYAAQGGQALHLHVCKVENEPFHAGDVCGHLFDQDMNRLEKTAGLRACVPHHEGTPRQHLDLCYTPLRDAIIAAWASGEETIGEEIPVVSLWQPWASAVAEGLKLMETRDHILLRSLAGRVVAIHAAKSWDDEAHFEMGKAIGCSVFDELRDRVNLRLPNQAKRYRFGAIVGLGLATGFRKLRYAGVEDRLALCACHNKWGLEFGRVVAMALPHVTGRQGVWYWNPGPAHRDLVKAAVGKSVRAIA